MPWRLSTLCSLARSVSSYLEDPRLNEKFSEKRIRRHWEVLFTAANSAGLLVEAKVSHHMVPISLSEAVPREAPSPSVLASAPLLSVLRRGEAL